MDDTRPTVTYKSMAVSQSDNVVGDVQSTVLRSDVFVSNGTTGCQLVQLSRVGREVTMAGAEGSLGTNSI